MLGRIRALEGRSELWGKKMVLTEGFNLPTFQRIRQARATP